MNSCALGHEHSTAYSAWQTWVLGSAADVLYHDEQAPVLLGPRSPIGNVQGFELGPWFPTLKSDENHLGSLIKS